MSQSTRHGQNYNVEIKLSSWACSEPVWWKDNIKNPFQNLFIPKPDLNIFTDASETWWGITDRHNPCQWAEHERMNINVLEFKTAIIGIHT